jgi:hypothetical protein
MIPGQEEQPAPARLNPAVVNNDAASNLKTAQMNKDEVETC